MRRWTACSYGRLLLLLPESGACPRSSAGALKTDIDSEGALRAFAVVHARDSKMYRDREMYVFVDFYT